MGFDFNMRAIVPNNTHAIIEKQYPEATVLTQDEWNDSDENVFMQASAYFSIIMTVFVCYIVIFKHLAHWKATKSSFENSPLGMIPPMITHVILIVGSAYIVSALALSISTTLTINCQSVDNWEKAIVDYDIITTTGLVLVYCGILAISGLHQYHFIKSIMNSASPISFNTSFERVAHDGLYFMHMFALIGQIVCLAFIIPSFQHDAAQAVVMGNSYDGNNFQEDYDLLSDCEKSNEQIEMVEPLFWTIFTASILWVLCTIIQYVVSMKFNVPSIVSSGAGMLSILAITARSVCFLCS